MMLRPQKDRRPGRDCFPLFLYHGLFAVCIYSIFGTHQQNSPAGGANGFMLVPTTTTGRKTKTKVTTTTTNTKRNIALGNKDKQSIYRRKCEDTLLLHAHCIQTAYEWLADERCSPRSNGNDHVYYQDISWIDLNDDDNEGNDDNEENDNDNDNNNEKDVSAKDASEGIFTMPLYPLGEVYLPSLSMNHTLNNVEPRNIKMALDLTNHNFTISNHRKNNKENSNHDKYEGCFCTALYASDTGRVSTVGTIMRIIEVQEVNYDNNNKNIVAPTTTPSEEGDTTVDEKKGGGIEEIPKQQQQYPCRVRITCRAEDIVDIVDIPNKNAASYRNRFLFKSSEYLRATVRKRNEQTPNVQAQLTTTTTEEKQTILTEQQQQQQQEGTATISDVNTSNKNNDGNSNSSNNNNDNLGDDEAKNVQELLSNLIRNYNTVRDLYTMDKTTIRVCHDLPPYMYEKLSSKDEGLQPLPEVFSLSSASSSLLFWEIATTWQTLCNTIREGMRIMLSSSRNEIMISAATKKGGPLQLPIHMEDLDLSERQKIQNLEVQTQEEFVDLGLDPCVDFLALLTLQSIEDRILFLNTLICKEIERIQQSLQKNEEQERMKKEKSNIDEVDEWRNFYSKASDSTDDSNKVQRKGAWFETDDWS